MYQTAPYSLFNAPHFDEEPIELWLQSSALCTELGAIWDEAYVGSGQM